MLVTLRHDDEAEPFDCEVEIEGAVVPSDLPHWLRVPVRDRGRPGMVLVRSYQRVASWTCCLYLLQGVRDATPAEHPLYADLLDVTDGHLV